MTLNSKSINVSYWIDNLLQAFNYQYNKTKWTQIHPKLHFIFNILLKDGSQKRKENKLKNAKIIGFSCIRNCTKEQTNPVLFYERLHRTEPRPTANHAVYSQPAELFFCLTLTSIIIYFKTEFTKTNHPHKERYNIKNELMLLV